MHHGTGYAVALLIVSVTQAAEPARAPAPAATVHTEKHANKQADKASQAVKPLSPPVTALRTPLKLTVGNVRKYMMPRQYESAITQSDNDAIIVQGERQGPPLKSTQPQPTGLGAVFSMFTNPGSAWRLFLPDPNGAPSGRPDPVPSGKQWYNSQ